MGLKNLKLNTNRFAKCDEDTFKSLCILVKLNLNNNLLDGFNMKEWFHGLYSLGEL